MNETKAAIDTARELNIVFKPTVTSLYKNQIHFLDCKQDSNRQLAHALHITWFIKLFPLLSFNRYIKGLHPLSFFEHQKTIMVFESNMGRFNIILVLSLSVSLCLFPDTISAQLRQNYYAQTCPNVEQIVRSAVQKKFQQTFVTVPATIRLFFHDCFVQGCDASVIIQSTGNNKAEKDHPDNLSLAGDGFDTVIKAKQAVDAIPSCRNKVSCADILAIATRDVIQLSGGPFYAVELGRLDGLSSTASSVNGKLPQPTFNLNQLNGLFAANGLDQTDMIALSAAHTVGFSHCSKFANRIYSFSGQNPVDPTLDKTYASQLQQMCPKNVDPRIAINMDPITPNGFDNQYFKNLQQGKGLFTSDQILFTDPRSKPIVNRWATSSTEFQKAFITAMTKMGRVGVKTGSNGNIRRDCSAFN